MNRFIETKVQSVFGRGEVYKISLTDSFHDKTQILTTYTPSEKERLDMIAHKFYDDTTKWFVIAKANKEVKGNIYATPGKNLVIPRIE